jgi:hypothetical protein
MDSLLAAIERGQRKFVCEEFSVEFAPSWDIEELRARVSSHWRNYHETGMSSLGGGSRVLPGFVPNTRPSRVVILALTREPPSGSDVVLFLKAVRRELCPGVYLCSSRSRKRKKDESTAAESYGSYFTPNLETRAEMYRLRDAIWDLDPHANIPDILLPNQDQLLELLRTRLRKCQPARPRIFSTAMTVDILQVVLGFALRMPRLWELFGLPNLSEIIHVARVSKLFQAGFVKWRTKNQEIWSHTRVWLFFNGKDPSDQLLSALDFPSLDLKSAEIRRIAYLCRSHSGTRSGYLLDPLCHLLVKKYDPQDLENLLRQRCKH